MMFLIYLSYCRIRVESEETSMAFLIGKYCANVTLIETRLRSGFIGCNIAVTAIAIAGILFSTYIEYSFHKLYFLIFVLFSRCAK